MKLDHFMRSKELPLNTVLPYVNFKAKQTNVWYLYKYLIHYVIYNWRKCIAPTSPCLGSRPSAVNSGGKYRRTELIIWPVVWNSFQHFIRGIWRSREAHWAHHLPRRLKQFSTSYTGAYGAQVFWSTTESTEWFIEVLPPPSPVSKLSLSFSVFLCVAGRAYTDGRGGGGRGAESCDRKKVWSSINHSILSCLQGPCTVLMNSFTNADPV